MKKKERTRIKICGLRRKEDALIVNEVLPDFAGFIFDPSRKRYVTPEAAEEIRRLLDPRIRSVGVFVNAGAETIRNTLAICHLDVLQLHGQESEEDILLLQKELEKQWRNGDRPVIIKAFRIDTIEDIRRAEDSPADGILLDHGPGGTGEAFDWSLLRDCRRPFFLAGGLSQDNIEEAIRSLHPYAVDVSSSLETDGWKDPAKIRRFMAAARRAEESEQMGQPADTKQAIANARGSERTREQKDGMSE